MPTEAVSHIYVIGAGASFGARDESNNRDTCPPLGDGLASYLEQWIADNEHGLDAPRCLFAEPAFPPEPYGKQFLPYFKAWLKQAQGGFENAMSELLRRQGEDWVGGTGFGQINRMMAAALSCGKNCRFLEKPDRYDCLLRSASSPDSMVVVSFNYDILLEEAATRVLDRANLHEAVYYPAIDEAESAQRPCLAVFKPHGSINWFQAGRWPHPGVIPESSSIYYEDNGLSSFTGADTNTEYVGQTRGEISELLAAHAIPLLALYARGKHVPDNQKTLESVRRECLEAVREASGAAITVIGLRPKTADDDQVVHELFEIVRAHDGVKTYVNPDKGDCVAARKFGLDAREEDLEEYLLRQDRCT